jgi:perosamine synthetase
MSVSGRFAGVRLPRLIPLLGSTTNWGDWLTALSYLANYPRLIQGPVIRKYEEAFARKLGVRYAYSFYSGRVGLYGILCALGVGPGDEVLLQVPTHIVVPNAIRYAGARPVYVDCRRDNYTMDLDQAEQRITPQTKVILLQHTFGIPADMDAALALARQYGLEVIEDCVHALGSKYAGRYVGTFGRAAFFSTEETKTISTTMGGMVVTDDPATADKIGAFQKTCAWPCHLMTYRRLLKLVVYHVQTRPHLHAFARQMYELLGRRNPLPKPTEPAELVGLKPPNYEQRLSNAQAALGLRQLRRLEQNVNHRRATAKAYNQVLAGTGVRLPCPPREADVSYVRYPIWVENREATLEVVLPHAIPGDWFNAVLLEARSAAAGDYTMGSCPNAELAAEHLLNLPTHLYVNAQDIEIIAAAVLSEPSNMRYHARALLGSAAERVSADEMSDCIPT